MHYVGVVLFVMLVLVILGYLWHAIHEFHDLRYGRCWTITIRTIEDLLDELTDNHYQQQIKDRAEKDVESLKQFIAGYNGVYDLDRISPNLDPEIYFFKELRSQVDSNWHFNESPLLTVIDSAIYAYNVDVEYHITTRQFLEYMIHQYEYHFISKL